MTETKKQEDLDAFIKQELNRPCHSSAHALVDAIMRRHGEKVAAILFYGSCLRQDPEGDPPEGIQDFYVVVDSFRRVFKGKPVTVLANRLLPPNVFYIERSWQKKKVRAKYAVISREQWRQGTSSKARQPWLWARFAQPAALLYARDGDCASEIAKGVSSAVTTMLATTLPLIEKPVSPGDLWREALRQTYKAELRPEGSDRADLIVRSAAERYDQITPLALKKLDHLPVKTTRDGTIETTFTRREKRQAQRRWRSRRRWGKPMSVLRLLKSVFTFDGGVNYALWKVERHTGVKVPVSRFERKHPILSSPRLLWRAYRLNAAR